eukprot:11467138-Alexandrium_andersonii.AAC.1
MNNMNGDSGFLAAVPLSKKLKTTFGLGWLATVCSSWIFLCMASTGRTKDCPRGSPTSPSAVAGNTMAARSCLLMLAMWAKRCFTVVEQPASTFTYDHPAFVYLRSLEFLPWVS